MQAQPRWMYNGRGVHVRHRATMAYAQLARNHVHTRRLAAPQVSGCCCCRQLELRCTGQGSVTKVFCGLSVRQILLYLLYPKPGANALILPECLQYTLNMVARACCKVIVLKPMNLQLLLMVPRKKPVRLGMSSFSLLFFCLFVCLQPSE